MIGTLTLWPTDAIPEKYLVCDGSQVSKTTYADLYAFVGDIYGAASEGFFKLPDYRGYFPRCFAGAATADPSSRVARGDGTPNQVVGTTQGDVFGRHRHLLHTAVGGLGVPGVFGTTSAGYHTWATTYTGGNETRPKNVYLTAIVRYTK